MTDYRHLPMGQTLSDGTNNYTVEKILGSGGFGITYLAKDEKLGRKVAIKEYYPGEFAGRDTTRSVVPITADQAELFAWGKERFLDEARMLAGFDHPNLLGVLGYFEANNTAYMVLPYIEGKTLGQRYKDKLLTEEEARELMLQLFDGLKQVHDKGVLHRDIKPANIILTGPEETPVLIDFGAARSALGQKSNSLTAIVSAPYSPREQYTTVLEQTPSTDIYSLGATIYRAMFGSGPPEAIVRDEVTELTELENSSKKGGISSQFERALRNTLEFRAANRPASVDQLRDMVELKPASSNNTESDRSSRQTDFTIADEKTKKKNATANEHHAALISPRPPPKSTLQQRRKRLALVALPVCVVVVYLFAVAFDGSWKDDKRQVALLNAQVAESRKQVGTLQTLLNLADEADTDTQDQIQSLATQLNTALARAAAGERRRLALETAERQRLEQEAEPIQVRRPPVRSGQALSAEERKAFMDDVRRCWVPPSASSELETTVVIAFSMTQDGKPIASSIRLVSSESGGTSAMRALQAARRAIIRCGARGFQLPSDKYDQWKDIEITFTGEDMRRD
jgi:serine/threonine protein kinase